MRKKILLLISIVLVSLFFIGCFNYKDINDALFVTSIVYDEEKENEITMYTEVFKAFRTTGKTTERGQRLTYVGRGKTIFEIIRDLTLTSSKMFNYTQNKVIIISERAARNGIKKYVDLSRRDTDFLVRPYVCVYKGDVEKLLKGNYKEEEYIGMFVFDLINNIGAASRAIEFHLDDFLNERLNAKSVTVITMLARDLDQGRDSIKIDGGAIIKDNKMVGELTKGESQAYNFIMNKIKSGTLEVTNPQSKKDYVSLEILKNNTKTQIYYDGKNITFKKIVNVKVSIAESQSNLVVNDEHIAQIEKYSESNIKDYCTKLFNKYKEQNIDIFALQDQFKDKYPSEANSIKDALKITNIEIEPHVSVESSGKANDFR